RLPGAPSLATEILRVSSGRHAICIALDTSVHRAGVHVPRHRSPKWVCQITPPSTTSFELIVWEEASDARGSIAETVACGVPRCVVDLDYALTTAIGRTGEPVAPTNFKGVQMKVKRETPAAANSSSCMFSMMWMPCRASRMR